MSTTTKRRVAVVVLLAVLVVAPLAADTGVGIILGDPTGISALFNNRIAAAVAWDVSNYFHLHADVWLIRRLLSEPVDWYLGVGGKMKVFTDSSEADGPPWSESDEDPPEGVGVGVRVPVGVQWYATPELEIFGEVVPGLLLLPGTGFDIDLGIGLRYHFGANIIE